MAQTLHSLVKSIETDSSLSRLAAIMKQRDILARKFLHQDTVSSVLASTTQTLGEFEVISAIWLRVMSGNIEGVNIDIEMLFFFLQTWRRLSISKNHLDLAKELSSPGTLYLVLQHSKDR